MEIIVNDTNIFIDLHSIGLLRALCDLPYDVRTVDFVINEIMDPAQSELLAALVAEGKIKVERFDMSSYRTTTSTSSMIGRGAIGGLMFGGVGVLAGANTASTTTVKENNRYKFNIVLNDFANPNFTCIIYDDEDAGKLYSILNLIIDKNTQS